MNNCEIIEFPLDKRMEIIRMENEQKKLESIYRLGNRFDNEGENNNDEN